MVEETVGNRTRKGYPYAEKVNGKHTRGGDGGSDGAKRSTKKLRGGGGRCDGPVAALVAACLCLSLLNVILMQRQMGDGGLKEMFTRQRGSWIAGEVLAGDHAAVGL